MNFVDISYKSVLALLIIFLGVILYVMLNGALNHPERDLEGVWKEVEWVYEKVDRTRSVSTEKQALRSRMKNEITEDLIIHKSETWEFKRKGKLLLTKENKDPIELSWRLKGRGHILKLEHENGALEFYQIRHLNSDKMVLHFDNNVHARGIVKIVFKKIK